MNFILNKLNYEIKAFGALFAYPFHKKEIIEKLSSNMTGINIETTNICNARCIFCAYQYQKRPKGIMTSGLFRKTLLDFIECGGGNLNLTPTVGDPLVDRNLIDRIKLARSYSEIKNIGIYSNLLFMDRFDARDFLQSGLSSLTISTSGFEKQMFRRVYRSPMYERVFRNIKKILEVNNNLGRPVNIFIDMRVDKSISDVKKSEDYLEIAGICGESKIGFKNRYDDWGGKIRKENLSGNMKLRSMPSFRHPRISACKELYNGPTIYWNGDVGACSCRDVDAKELVIGDIGKRHLADIWFGDEARKLRNEFLTKRCKDICGKCSHYTNLSLYCLPEYRKSELNLVRPMPMNLSRKKH